MKKTLKSQILKVFPSEEMKKFLNQEDFDTATSLIDIIRNDLAVYEGPFSLFNDLYYAIESEDMALFHKIFVATSNISMLSAISTILTFHSAINDPEKRNTLAALEKSYFKALIILNNYEELKNIDEIAVFKSLISLKKKRYNKVRSLKSVFNMPLLDDLTSSYASLAEYIEALIYSNEISPEDVIYSLLKQNYDILMENVQILACLKEKYMELKEEEITEIEENARRKIESIEEIGFPRN